MGQRLLGSGRKPISEGPVDQIVTPVADGVSTQYDTTRPAARLASLASMDVDHAGAPRCGAMHAHAASREDNDVDGFEVDRDVRQ